MHIKNLSEIFRDTKMELFSKELSISSKSYETEPCVQAINCKKLSPQMSKPELELLILEAKTFGSSGVLTWKIESENDWKGAGTKFLSDNEKRRIQQALNVEAEDMLLIVAGPRHRCEAVLGRLRTYTAALMREKKLLPQFSKDIFKFLWVVDFPLFTPVNYDQENSTLQSTHHPFTASHPEDLPLLKSNAGPSAYRRVRGLHYDCVVNGVELGGGSIRIHQASVQEHVLKTVLGLGDGMIARFGHLLTALKTGCPPHGGLAIGFDRMVAMICGEDSLRNVIAFPKTSTGTEPMTNSPGSITNEELATMNLQLLKSNSYL